MKKNNPQDLNIRLTNADKNTQIIITYKHPTKEIIDLVLHKQQDLNIYGISFTLKNNAILSEKGKEIKSFQIPGSYYINIYPDGLWKSGKTFSPFEGKTYPKYQH